MQEGKKCNGLEEGEAGPREMSKLELAKRKCPDSAFEDFVDYINNELQPRTLNSPLKAPCEAISGIFCDSEMEIDARTRFCS